MQSLGIEVLFKGTNFLRLLGGLWVAVRISLISVAISIALGIVVGMLRVRMKPYRKFRMPIIIAILFSTLKISQVR